MVKETANGWIEGARAGRRRRTGGRAAVGKLPAGERPGGVDGWREPFRPDGSGRITMESAFLF